MTKYVCDICGEEVSGNDLHRSFIQSESLRAPFVDIDVCLNCRQKIIDNKNRVSETICKAIREMNLSNN